MPALYGKTGGVWSQANVPVSKLLWVRWNGSWVAAKGAFVKSGGSWIDTGITGLPLSPQLPTGQSALVTSAADNFTTVSLGYWGPTGGPAPTGFIARMYNSSGGLLVEINPSTPGYSAGTASFSVSINTSYIFRVYSVNAAGESTGYLEARYAIGHPQQTRQDPVNGWQTEYDHGVEVTLASSQKSDHLSGGAADWKNDPYNCWLTTWMSEPRPAYWCMDALRFYPKAGPNGDTTRLNGVRIWPSYGVQMFIGLWNEYHPGGWLGSNTTPNDAAVWYNPTAYNTFGTHKYHVHTGVGTDEYHYRPIDYGFDVRAGHMICDIIMWDLPKLDAAWYAGIKEVIFRLSNYGVVGYTTVVTVAQQNNSYW
jgi:hypothetical protein